MSKTSKASSPMTKVRADRRAMIALLIVPILLLAVWFLFTAPARSAASEAKEKAAAAEAQDKEVSAKLTALRSGKAPSSTNLLNQARTLDQQLPLPNTNPIALGTEITQLAAASGVTISQLNKGTAFSEGDVSIQGFSIIASGSQSQVSSFLLSLSKFPQLLTIPKLTVTLGGGAPTTTTTSSAAPVPTGSTTVSFDLYAWYSAAPYLTAATR